MIDIECENELIQIDIIDFITDSKSLKSGNYIKCNVYFKKFDCIFTSKDVVFGYDKLNQFNFNLKKLLNNKNDCCFLIDQNHVISLKFEVDQNKFSPNPLGGYNIYSLEFELLYYASSDISLTGHLCVYKNSLEKMIEEIELVL